MQFRAGFYCNFCPVLATGSPGIWSGLFEYRSFLNSRNRKAAGKPAKSSYSSLNSKAYFPSFHATQNLKIIHSGELAIDDKKPVFLSALSLILSLFVWLCAGLLSCSSFVFKLASGLLSLLANASACFSEITANFLANLEHNISKKGVVA